MIKHLLQCLFAWQQGNVLVQKKKKKTCQKKKKKKKKNCVKNFETTLSPVCISGLQNPQDRETAGPRKKIGSAENVQNEKIKKK